MASIGLNYGQPFEPDPPRQQLLGDAAHFAAAVARANTFGIDVYFGASLPEGQRHNWIQTVPDPSWFPVFHAYGLIEAYVDHTWKLPEFQSLDHP